MEDILRPQKVAPALEGTSVSRRHDPKVRREMSGPALRTFLNISEKWGLSNEEQRALLGWPSPTTFRRYKSGRAGTLSYDELIRISLVIAIFRDLHTLYTDEELADTWIKLPNNNPIFGGKSALAFISDAGIDGLYQVRRLLDARCGGWN